MDDAFCRLAVEMALVDWFLFLLPPLPVAMHQVELLDKLYFAEICLSIPTAQCSSYLVTTHDREILGLFSTYGLLFRRLIFPPGARRFMA